MLRKLNFTGRRRIEQERLSFSLASGSDGIPRLTANRIDLTGLELAGPADVYVEIQRRHQWHRIPCGTVDNLQKPQAYALSDFPKDADFTIRVLVVDTSARHGLILAMADHLRCTERDGESVARQPLLPVQVDDGLDEEIFRLEMESEEGTPVLVVNRNIPDVAQRIRTDITFAALVYPAVLRELLTHLFVLDATEPSTDEADEPRARWFEFASGLAPGSELPPAHSDDDTYRTGAIEWVNDVVAGFARQRQLATDLRNQLEA